MSGETTYVVAEGERIPGGFRWTVVRDLGPAPTRAAAKAATGWKGGKVLSLMARGQGGCPAAAAVGDTFDQVAGK